VALIVLGISFLSPAVHKLSTLNQFLYFSDQSIHKVCHILPTKHVLLHTSCTALQTGFKTLGMTFLSFTVSEISTFDQSVRTALVRSCEILIDKWWMNYTSIVASLRQRNYISNVHVAKRLRLCIPRIMRMDFMLRSRMTLMSIRQ